MTTGLRFGRTFTASAITIVLLLVCCAGPSPVQSDEGKEHGPERRQRPPTYHAAIREGRKAAREVLKEGKASALTIALVTGNGVVWSQAFGFADREARQKATTRTMFGIGSVSKLFATVAVLKLVEKGLVDLDRPLIEYLPAFQMASPEYRKVTVRMLLNHTSGFPGTDYRNGETTSPFPEYFDQVLQSLSIERLKVSPGYMNVYCNDGFTITAALVQATTGKSFAEFVQDETWLLVNERPDSLSWPIMDPRLRLATAVELNGLVAVRPPFDTGFFIVDPSASDTVATMMLTIPQLAGRDLNDLDIVVRDGVEWTRFGSYLHRPLDGVPMLPGDATSTVTIGADGYAEWRAVASGSTPVRVDIETSGAWRIYDSAFKAIASGEGRSQAALPPASGPAYIILFGDPGQTMAVTVSGEGRVGGRHGRDDL